jgi:hypothetical protein
MQQKQRLVRKAKPFTLKNGPRQQSETMFDNNKNTDGDEKTT